MSVVDTSEVESIVRGAVGLGTPAGMVTNWFLIGAFVILTSSIGLVGTLLLMPVVILGLVIGVARFFDPVEAIWPLT